MPELNLNAAAVGSETSKFEITPAQLDVAGELEETEYSNSRWSTQLGAFLQNSDLKSAIIMKAIWAVGKGWSADAETKVILEHIRGWGIDSFDDVLFNMEIQKRIGGDAFAEIIRDEDSNLLINLKPLDPGSMKWFVNKQGIITKYQQTNKIGGKTTFTEFKPNEILHFCHNRIGSQIHGLSDVDIMLKTIEADEESFKDMIQVSRRLARPFLMFKLKTDNTSKINTFIIKMDEGTEKGKNVYIPDDENMVSYEVVQLNISDIILAWRREIREKFYRNQNLPLVLFGSAGATESGSKMEYLAHEQIFENSQRKIERDIEAQLGLKINLIPPTTLLENLQTDEAKDSQNALTLQRNDAAAGSGR